MCEWYMKMLFDYAGVLAGFEINRQIPSASYVTVLN